MGKRDNLPSAFEVTKLAEQLRDARNKLLEQHKLAGGGDRSAPPVDDRRPGDMAPDIIVPSKPRKASRRVAK
ncbi:MAG: hypothetical protein WD042_12285 [Phycisphaeraceae bacterium]